MKWTFWGMGKPEPAPEPEHKHHYVATHCRTIKEASDDIVTILIRSCECGDSDYYRVPGEWTMEELTGKPPKFNDAKFLRDCGIKRY